MTSIICDSADLEEGKAIRFVLHGSTGDKPAFVIRHGGRVYAYVNECQHMALELDWNPGDFFDLEKQHLICATHGALYRPETGECVAGPCKGAKLKQIAIRESGENAKIELADSAWQALPEF